jgi:ubiquinone/menaquinone biosynthesis C-methylase UbiE
MPDTSIDEAAFEDSVGYERFMGRWSRLAGVAFVGWLCIPPHSRWLDVGCGTGAFTNVVATTCNPLEVVGLDPSPSQIEFARRSCGDSRLEFKVGNVASLEEKDGEFDAVTAALVLNFVPSQQQALREMSRVVRRGGTVAAYVWDFAGQRNISQHLMNAVIAAAPQSASLLAGLNAESNTLTALAERFASSGLSGIETKHLDIAATFRDFDDYWTSNTRFRSPVANLFNSLPEARRRSVRQTLRQTLAPKSNGAVVVEARALAVRGIRRE